MRVVIHKSGMLEMSIINVIFLTNVEKWPILITTSLLFQVKVKVICDQIESHICLTQERIIVGY